MAANEPLNELSTTDASNTPIGTDVVGSTLDDELRSIKANIARSARWEQTATQSVAVTLAVSALHKLFPVEGSVGGSTTITLPEVASAGAGFSVAFKKIDNVNDVIIDGNGAEQIDGAASRTMKAQYEGLVLVCNGSSWDVAADGERLVVPSFTVDGALNTGTLFVNGNEITGLEGTVPAPANPGEDTYLLEASGGTWDWQSPANVKTNMSFGALADLNTVNTAQITNDAVTYAKIQNVVANNVLLGNNSGAGGIVDELSATEVRAILNVTDGANAYTHPPHTGDVTSLGDGATTIANDAVTYAKIQNVVANNVLLGNNSGAGGIVDELSATEVRTLLNVADGANAYTHPPHTGDVTSLGDGATTIANDAVTYAKIQNVVSNNVLLGNNAGAGGIVDELSATEVRTLLNVANGANAYTHPPHTGDVTSLGDGATTIANNAVTLSKLEHGTSGDILYYGAAGEPFRLAKGTDTQILTLASGLPSWADASSSGGWELVSTITPTVGVDDTVDFSGLDTSTYVHIVTYNDVAHSAGLNLYSLSCRLKNAGTNVTSNYDYGYLNIGVTTGNLGTTGISAANTAQLNRPDASILYYDGGTINGYMMFWMDADSGQAMCRHNVVGMDLTAGGTTRGHDSTLNINDFAWTDFDGIGFYLTGSTFASGTFQLKRRPIADLSGYELNWN